MGYECVDKIGACLFDCSTEIGFLGIPRLLKHNATILKINKKLNTSERFFSASICGLLHKDDRCSSRASDSKFSTDCQSKRAPFLGILLSPGARPTTLTTKRKQDLLFLRALLECCSPA
jgi:hypothetical protein